MADTCANRPRKCEGLRRGPQFGVWMWCIIIKWLISLPCIFSSCQGVDISVATYPDSVNLRYGESLEIFCVADKGTAEDLVFELNGTPLPSEIINSTTRRFFIRSPERQMETYYCKNTATNRQCVSRVLVDSQPSQVTDFGCISKNIEELNCTWSQPPVLYSVTNYSLSFAIKGNSVTSCPIYTEYGKNRSCVWNAGSKPRYKQQEENFYFNLTSCNYFGCTVQNFTLNHFSVVKPDKPLHLKVIRNEPHRVLLQWRIPDNIHDFLGCALEHKIEYQIAKIDNTSYFRSVDVSSLPPRARSVKFWLSDLPYAHRQYEVRVYIKSALATDDRFWSDFTYVVFYTASERPQRPPRTIAGAFAQALFDNKRMIYVYWQQLEEYEEAGANFTYKVVVRQGSKSPQTLHPDKNKSMSYVVLNDATLEAIDVSIWSRNANGSSVNSSHLYIPAKHNTEALHVSSFTKLAFENGTYKLSWGGIKNIDNYTLFWCHHNTSKMCTGRMNFMALDPYKNSHLIHLSTDNRYQFAIAANNGSKTSGMIWASCEITKDLIPMYGFPVKMENGVPGKSHVRITWSMSCTLQEGIINGYQITYCPVVDTSNDCDSSLGNKSIRNITDPKRMEVNITDLKPYRTYIFKLALSTANGLKTIENTSIAVTTTEDTPSSPRNVSVYNILNDSLYISWDPPQHRNGIIGKYVILNFGQEFKVVEVPDKDKDNVRREVKLSRLQGFTNYSLSVQACNIGISSCSAPSPRGGMFVRTRIGCPSKLDAPIVIQKHPDLLKWNPPRIPGGTVDMYQIKRVRDQNPPEIINATNFPHSLLLCEGVDLDETYQVRALNYDNDRYHGALAVDEEVILPERNGTSLLVFYGEWSDTHPVSCRSKDGLTMTVSLLAVFAVIGIVYLGIKLYKQRLKKEDIKPVLPVGLGVPEKDISKYAFGAWNPTNKEDKPSSDEMLLLPNSRTTVSTPEKKNNENNCGASDHTDSTALSDTSRGPVERQASTSDDGSDTSLHLEVEPVRSDDIGTPDEECSNSETELSGENSPYFSDNNFKKNTTSGYVQPVVSPTTGYVQSAPAPHKSPLPKSTTLPTTSSYVMAALSPPIFTTGVAQPSLPSQPPTSSGYVRPEDAQAKSMINFPKLTPTPMKLFGPDSLPTMPTLPQSVKHGNADSSYIQLQSLDALPSHKQPVRNTATLKPQASSGYVSQGDAVMNKHLNNMLSGGQLAEESAILDPAMSPDAYCRFSWSTDPTNDNLHSLLADPHTLNSSKN